MNKKLQVIFGLIIIGLILFTLTMKSISNKEKEDFDTFNVKFHSDSIYQMSRINFPIEGKLIEGFEKHSWNVINWELMTTQVGSKSLPKEFKVKTIKTDSLVIENIWIENSGFKLERKFKKINDNWFLTYYNEVNL